MPNTGAGRLPAGSVQIRFAFWPPHDENVKASPMRKLELIR
jgi:hypothetical protein